MANVTYLLGAGASYNALPVVDELPSAINGVVGELGRRRQASNRIYREANMQNALDTAVNHLKRLENGTKNHLSIDTYAKMLFLTKNAEYENTKSAISLFFRLYHHLKFPIYAHNRQSNDFRRHIKLDSRYDAFLASILLNSYDQFPDNIKVLSYNYDDQFERAYSNYLTHANANERIYELMNIYRRNENVAEYKSDKFSFFKINGTAGFFNEDASLIDPYKFIEEQEDAIKDELLAFSTYINNSTKYKSSISFAWDSLENTHTLLENIKNATKDTIYLVVIGYSLL